MAFDNNGKIWVASAQGGISNFDGKNWINFNSINSDLLNNLTTSIAVDKYNNIWIGTISGLSKYNGNTWTNYTQSNSKILDNNVLDILIDKQDQKWIVTNNGISRLSKTKLN
jgi:ligand-binding sensor domain-containing protein